MRELLFMEFPDLHRESTDAYLHESISTGNTPITDKEWEEWYERKFNIKLEIQRNVNGFGFKSVKRYYVTEEQYALVCLRWL